MNMNMKITYQPSFTGPKEVKKITGYLKDATKGDPFMLYNTAYKGDYANLTKNELTEVEKLAEEAKKRIKYADIKDTIDDALKLIKTSMGIK